VGLIDRFTRDEVSAKVWWPFALLFVVLIVASFRVENRAADERRADAGIWSVGVIRGLLEPSLDTSGITRPLTDEEIATTTAALQPALSEDAVDAVRIWSTDGTLLYSSSRDDPVGSREALNDSELQAAAAAPESSLSVTADRSLSGSETDPLFLTYATFVASTSSIGEVQMTQGVLLADIDTAWLQIRLVLLAGALFLLTLAVLSMREPVATIGAGVKFYPTSLPASLVVLDRDEEAALRGSRPHVRSRTGSVEARVAELEETKLALEGELQRALSSLAVLRGAKGGTPRVIPPAPAPTTPVVRLPEASLAEIEDSIPASGPAEPPPKAKTPTKSKAKAPAKLRAVRAPEPEPRREAEPAREPEPAVPAAEPEPSKRAEPESLSGVEVVAPEPGPSGSLREPLLDLIILPEPEPASVQSAATEEQGDAVDVLNRLVAPASPEHDQVDPGAIRAKLARTAALKKPGSRERREEQERRVQGDQEPH
jgi:hypothetical protein